jgi:hypothetical protein
MGVADCSHLVVHMLVRMIWSSASGTGCGEEFMEARQIEAQSSEKAGQSLILSNSVHCTSQIVQCVDRLV